LAIITAIANLKHTIGNKPPFSQRLPVCKQHHGRNHLASLGFVPDNQQKQGLHGWSCISHLVHPYLHTPAVISYQYRLEFIL